MEAIEIRPINFTAKGASKSKSSFFTVEDMIDLFNPNITIRIEEPGINHSWKADLITNGDGTVSIKRYDRNLPFDCVKGFVIEDEERIVTHIQIPVYAVIKTDNKEYPYMFEAQISARIKVSNPKHIFDYK